MGIFKQGSSSFLYVDLNVWLVWRTFVYQMYCASVEAFPPPTTAPARYPLV